MSENLSIKILSLQENGFELQDCSCVLILGSTILTGKIPTQSDLIINTTKIADEEMLSLIIKHNGQNIVKSFIPVGAVRRDINYKVKLEPLGVKAEIGSTFSLDLVFTLNRDGKEVHSEKKAENPFQQNLYKSETGFTTQDFYTTIKSENVHRDEAEIERIINEVKLERYGVIQEVKPAGEVSDLRNQTDVNNLIQDLKASVDLMERNIESRTVDIHQELENAIIEPEFQEKNFAQSAPAYTAEEFHTLQENNSPQFGNKGFNYTVPSEIKIYDTETQQTVTLKVPEARGSYHVNKWEEHNKEGDSYVERKSERRSSKQFSETARSAIEDVKIEKNETYVLSMKNQLSSKHISFINDAFSREIILYMAQSKKKVSAVRLRRSIMIGNKEDVDIDKKEFFNTNCNTKFIHFFQPSSRTLCLYNLVQPFDHVDDAAKKVPLNIDFDISPHHKSVITPSGLIFIASARPEQTDSQVVRGSNSLHVLNYKNYTLVEKPSMLCGSREEFGFCYMSKNLFAIGGLVNGVISNQCERFDIRANKWIKIAPMTRPLKEASVCSFNNRYLYRFFGIDSGNNIDHSIERYDAVRDTWTIMNVPMNDIIKEIYQPFCTQVNQDCIFMFGGKNINGFAPKTCKGWVLKVEDKRGSNNAALVESKNFIPGLAGAFNGNSVLTHAGDILFLRESY